VILRRALVGLGLVTASLTALSGAAAAKTVSPDTYASSLCTALGDWEHKTDALSQNITAGLTDAPTLDAAKNVLTTNTQQLRSDTDLFLKALQRAGAPNVPNGKNIASRFVRGVTSFRQAVARLDTEAATIPTGDAAAFDATRQASLQRFRSALTKFGAVIGKFSDGDTSGRLARAMFRQSSCSFLFGSSAPTTI
jgi:hypothetical protein